MYQALSSNSTPMNAPSDDLEQKAAEARDRASDLDDAAEARRRAEDAEEEADEARRQAELRNS